MQAEARVGIISAAEGTINPLRVGTEGGLVLDSHGKYYEAVKAARVFVACNQAAVAVTAAMATAYTGLVVENPTTSGKDLVMLRFGWTLTVAAPTAATVLGLMTGLDAGDAAAAITPRNRYVGGAGSAAIVDNACTLTGTPVLEQIFTQIGSAATNLATIGPIGEVDLDGSLIIPPGYYVAVYSFAANTACGIFSLMWEELTV